MTKTELTRRRDVAASVFPRLHQKLGSPEAATKEAARVATIFAIGIDAELEALEAAEEEAPAEEGAEGEGGD